MADGIALVKNGRTRRQSGSRTGRILAGMGAGLLTRVLDFGKRFVLVPLFLTAWGGARYRRRTAHRCWRAKRDPGRGPCAECVGQGDSHQAGA